MRLPRDPSSPDDGTGELYFGSGEFVVLLGRGDYWQVGYVVPKGGYERLKAAGAEALKQAVARVARPSDKRCSISRSGARCPSSLWNRAGYRGGAAPGCF
jgi:hypothetical protein